MKTVVWLYLPWRKTKLLSPRKWKPLYACTSHSSGFQDLSTDEVATPSGGVYNLVIIRVSSLYFEASKVMASNAFARVEQPCLLRVHCGWNGRKLVKIEM